MNQKQFDLNSVIKKANNTFQEDEDISFILYCQEKLPDIHCLKSLQGNSNEINQSLEHDYINNKYLISPKAKQNFYNIDYRSQGKPIFSPNNSNFFNAQENSINCLNFKLGLSNKEEQEINRKRKEIVDFIAQQMQYDEIQQADNFPFKCFQEYQQQFEIQSDIFKRQNSIDEYQEITQVNDQLKNNVYNNFISKFENQNVDVQLSKSEKLIRNDKLISNEQINQQQSPTEKISKIIVKINRSKDQLENQMNESNKQKVEPSCLQFINKKKSNEGLKEISCLDIMNKQNQPMQSGLNNQGQDNIKKRFPKCNCSKTKCLKLYCECFQNGEQCSINCTCQNCKNVKGNEKIINDSKNRILNKNPIAFETKMNKIQGIFFNAENQAQQGSGKIARGCKCKNSQCLKNYCECYENNLYCSKYCKCIGCLNLNNDSINLNKIKESAQYQKQNDELSINSRKIIKKLHLY